MQTIAEVIAYIRLRQIEIGVEGEKIVAYGVLLRREKDFIKRHRSGAIEYLLAHPAQPESESTALSAPKDEDIMNTPEEGQNMEELKSKPQSAPDTIAPDANSQPALIKPEEPSPNSCDAHARKALTIIGSRNVFWL